MKAKYEMRFTGAGGQGVILCSIILAEAAFLTGKIVAQSQSYGPEARGGLCRAELVIDEAKIVYPKVTHADFLLALTQASLDKYGPGVPADAMIVMGSANGSAIAIVMDSSLQAPENLGSGNVVALPILYTASKVVGNVLTANIVSAGAIDALLGIAPGALLEQAMRMHAETNTINYKLYIMILIYK